MKEKREAVSFIEKNPIIMIILGICGISVSAILVKYSSAPSEVTAAYRLCFTVLLMSPVVFLRKESRNELFSVDKRTVFMCIVSGIALAVHFVTWFESLKHTSVASSTTIVCTEVVWVALGFCLFMHGKLSKQAVMAIIVTLAGSVLIAMSDSSSGGAQLYGDILSIIAAVAVALYTLIGRAARSTVSTTVYTYIVYCACAFVLVAFSVFKGNRLYGYGLNSYLVGLLLAICSTILGHSIFSWCLKYFSPAFVSASKLCEPVVAATLAAILFGEIPDIFVVAGGCIILAGVIWYSRIETAKK